jgi:hypothetical protein
LGFEIESQKSKLLATWELSTNQMLNINRTTKRWEASWAEWGQKIFAAIGLKRPQRHCGASIPLKMYLKRLAILEKASIFLKKSSKIFEMFIKAPHF